MSLLFAFSVVLPQDAVILCAKGGIHLFKSCCEGEEKVEVIIEKDSCCKTETVQKTQDEAQLKSSCCQRQSHLANNFSQTTLAKNQLSTEVDDSHTPFYFAIISHKNFPYKTSPKALPINGPPLGALATRRHQAPIYQALSSYLC